MEDKGQQHKEGAELMMSDNNKKKRQGFVFQT